MYESRFGWAGPLITVVVGLLLLSLTTQIQRRPLASDLPAYECDNPGCGNCFVLQCCGYDVGDVTITHGRVLAFNLCGIRCYGREPLGIEPIVGFLTQCWSELCVLPLW